MAITSLAPEVPPRVSRSANGTVRFEVTPSVGRLPVRREDGNPAVAARHARSPGSGESFGEDADRRDELPGFHPRRAPAPASRLPGSNSIVPDTPARRSFRVERSRGVATSGRPFTEPEQAAHVSRRAVGGWLSPAKERPNVPASLSLLSVDGGRTGCQRRPATRWLGVSGRGPYHRPVPRTRSGQLGHSCPVSVAGEIDPTAPRPTAPRSQVGPPAGRAGGADPRGALQRGAAGAARRVARGRPDGHRRAPSRTCHPAPRRREWPRPARVVSRARPRDQGRALRSRRPRNGSSTTSPSSTSSCGRSATTCRRTTTASSPSSPRAISRDTRGSSVSPGRTSRTPTAASIRTACVASCVPTSESSR